ncbi:hypothetical protein CLOP_g3575 [Closterium sp. NIES-67]|nr:hypothetical protein CLOP_g3575 [Closterium sp. NIES-67]
MCSSDDEDDGGEDDHSAERFVRVAPLRGLDFLRRAHAAPVYSNPLPSLSSEEWERNQDDVTELVDSPSKAPPATRPATTTPAATRPATSTPAATRPATSTPAATPPATTTSVAVTSKKRRRYEQSHLPFAPPPPKPPTPPPPERVTAPSAKPTVAEKTARAYEKAQHKYTNDWLPKFPWLVLDKNDDGIPCLRCSVCMEHGAVHARYGREGSGGRDLQVGSMRWHQESQKHEDAVRKQQHLLTEVENQKRMEDFVANDPEGARIIRLLRAMLFICKEDAPISMFTRLVGFMAHEGVKDVPKQSYGVYITQYGFKEMVKAMVAFLQAQQMSHIHASPFIGLSCDESTDRTRGKHLILFATFLKKRKVVTEFLALLTVDKCDAASLQAIILSHLETLGVDLQKISGISTDGASVMTGEHHGLVARLRMRIPHLVGVHCIAHRESLAVKDAAAAFPDFKIIDAVIRALGEIVGRSTPWYERFKHLQMVIHNTNLEHQGLYLIRWLSRGDAIKRLCSILGAAIVVLIEYNHKLAPVVKTLKFHYCLYFLADVLAEMNTLNRWTSPWCPRRLTARSPTSGTVTSSTVRHSGGGMSKRLTKFLQRHASGKRSIVVDGMDNDGSPCTHAFELSEEKLPGHKFGGSMSDYEDLCSAFAKDMVANVEQRLWDLKRMGGAGLFKVECWPKKAEVRERRHLSWLASNVALFDHKLPGVNQRAAELELKTFVHIMKNHRADDDFNQGLAAMLKTRDWPKSYPNLMALWQAMAVLPLSTVECERGFSRQNVIKSWLRTSLCDARLSELMTINMLDYDMDYAEIVDIWRKQKMRKQAKTVAYETPLDKGKSAAEDSDEEIAASEGSYEDDDDDDDDDDD